MYFYRNLLAHNGLIEEMNLSIASNELREILMLTIKKITHKFISFDQKNTSSYIQNIHWMVNTNKISLKKLLDMRWWIDVWYTWKDKDEIIMQSLIYPRTAAYHYDKLYSN